MRARPASQEIPLVLLTSLGRRAEDMADRRFAACLTKPVKAAQLYDALLAALSGVETAPAERRHTGYDTTLAERIPLRILLAEDNAVNQKVALKTLEKLGYRADVAANGLEALDALARQPYDVVLMDVQMPELDGLGAAQRIRGEVPPARQPRIIAMTANAMQSDREQCLAAGMDDYISKPVRVEDLVAALERSGLRELVVDRAAAVEHLYLIQLAVLEKIQENLGGGNPAIVIEIIDLFLEDLPQQLATLRQGYSSEATPVVQRIAHTIKASAATIGALGLAAECETLEDRVRLGDSGDAKQRIEAIEAAAAAATTELARVRQRLATIGHA
jgi:CheY-like chemotaxis protein